MITPEEEAATMIKDAKRSKTKLYEVPGKCVNFVTDMVMIDQDYQMIDTHIDKPLKHKIQCFEYIDFSKLISKNKNNSEDQRMEILTAME